MEALALDPDSVTDEEYKKHMQQRFDKLYYREQPNLKALDADEGQIPYVDAPKCRAIDHRPDFEKKLVLRREEKAILELEDPKVYHVLRPGFWTSRQAILS